MAKGLDAAVFRRKSKEGVERREFALYLSTKVQEFYRTIRMDNLEKSEALKEIFAEAGLDNILSTAEIDVLMVCLISERNIFEYYKSEWNLCSNLFKFIEGLEKIYSLQTESCDELLILINQFRERYRLYIEDREKRAKLGKQKSLGKVPASSILSPNQTLSDNRVKYYGPPNSEQYLYAHKNGRMIKIRYGPLEESGDEPLDTRDQSFVDGQENYGDNLEQ